MSGFVTIVLHLVCGLIPQSMGGHAPIERQSRRKNFFIACPKTEGKAGEVWYNGKKQRADAAEKGELLMGQGENRRFYEIFKSKDVRYDGRIFVGVSSTGGNGRL